MGLEKYLKGKTIGVDISLQINFRLLRQQKAQLEKTIEAMKNKKEKELLTGILNLIDGVQDSACNEFEGGLTELHVFGKQKNNI